LTNNKLLASLVGGSGIPVKRHGISGLPIDSGAAAYTLGDTWTFQYKVVCTNRTSPNDNFGAPISVSSSASGGSVDTSDSASSFGLYMNASRIYSMIKEGANTTVQLEITTIGVNSPRWLTVTRTNSTTIIYYSYTNSARTAGVQSATAAISTNPDMIVIKGSSGANTNKNIGWTVSEMKIWNDVTSSTTPAGDPNTDIVDDTDWIQGTDITIDSSGVITASPGANNNDICTYAFG
jgi:hypothetical protein